MPNIPVLLYHKSEQIHVRVALRSAKRYNADVILLTDTDCAAYRENARLEMAADYLGSAKRLLAPVYRHMSANIPEFEYDCIERWFALFDYMQAHALREILYIDSDVMTYSDYTTAIRSNFRDCDYCLCIPDQSHSSFDWAASGHISYWTVDALNVFCQYVHRLYTEQLELLESKWQWHKDKRLPGGICDMTLLYLFQRSTPLRCGNLLEVAPDDTAFDVRLNTGFNQYAGEYRTRYNRYLGDEIKDLHFRDGQAYAFHLGRQREVRLHGVHFQGGTKKLMPFFERPVYIPGLFPWIARYAYLDTRIWLGRE